MAQGLTTVFSEDFENLTLGPSLDEGTPGTEVWTKTSPNGWTINDSGVPGNGNDATDGVTEWAGWSFADKDWWTETAGDQNRSRFVSGRGTVAIADPDEWDDQPHTAGLYNAFLSTPSINIADIPAGQLFVNFDSSWRPEASQTATLTATYDGGSPIEILRWESDPGSLDFHPDAPDEAVAISLDNPAGGNSLVLEFGLIDAGNNWWWAFDILKILFGEKTGPAITKGPRSVSILAGCVATFSAEASGTPPFDYQWFKDGALITGATAVSYTVTNTTLESAGSYSVEISNSAGSAFSEAATLTISPDPVARSNSPFGNKRVLLIGIDGCRVDSFLAADTPNIDALAADGAFSWAARCSIGQSTVSGPGWSTILTGVWAEKHHVNNNNFSSNNYNTYPHLFTRIREAHSSAFLSSIVNWSPINESILRDEDFQLSGLSDLQVGLQAACHLLSYGPDVTFLHFDELDGAGHGGGYDPDNPNFLTTLNRIDGYVGTVLDAVNQRSAQLEEDWLVIITSDHGGTPGGSHGGQSLDELMVPMIINGGGTRVGELPTNPFNTFIVPTIFAHLGIEVSAEWDLDGKTTALKPVLRVAPNRADSTVSIQWPGIVTLQRAPGVEGPWISVPDMFSPFSTPHSEEQEYFRLEL